MSTRIEFCTVAGVQLNLCPAVQSKLIEKNWQVDHIAFCSMIPVGQKRNLMTGQNEAQVVPTYTLFCSKEFLDGQETDLPQIKITKEGTVE